MKHVVATLMVVVSLWPAPARAQEFRYPASFHRYDLVDALITGAFGALAVTTEIIGGPREARWDHEILLDLPTRRALGSESARGEHVTAALSDGLLVAMIAAPFADAGLAGGAVHHDGITATQLTLVSLESFALTFGLTNITKVSVGRARPPVAECFASRQDDPNAACDPRPTVSFFSGHSSSTFTGAGLICGFGTAMPLHGKGVAGQVPCISALALATTTAVLRIAANKHHLSDVIVGSAIGLLSGWLWPKLRFFGN